MSIKHLTVGSVDPPRTNKELLRVYSNKYCPYVKRVLLVLIAKKIPHEVVNINLQYKPEWFLQLNPIGKVPVLLDGSKVMLESLDIAAYLDEKYPEPPLSPSDPEAKKRDQEAVEKLAPVQRMFFKLLFPDRDHPTKPEEWSPMYMDAWKDLESELSQRGTPFFGGASPGMVDFMIWPTQDMFEALEVPRGLEIPLKEKYIPLLRQWRKDMLKNPVCQEQEVTLDLEGLRKLSVAMQNNQRYPYDG